MPFDEDLEDDLRELSSAEDFLEYFEIDFDPSVVRVNRLHILQRFHNYLNKNEGPEDVSDWRGFYAECLTRAYTDFVTSSALQEKVFKVFQDQAKPANFVSADSLLG